MTTASAVRSVCPYCGVGCGIVMQTDGRRVIKVSGDKAHPSNFGRLCTKGSTCAQALQAPGRLDSAFMRQSRQGEPARAPMPAAISETARRLKAIVDAHGPDAMALYVSGQMSMEAQYLANKLAKGFIGTRHIESNSRLCMASAGSGYKMSLGADGPPGSYLDFDRADVFFVIGANMADCHPILFLRMMDRVKAGAKLIVVDPRRNTTADKASLFLPIRPGTDLALLNGLLHLLVKNGHTDAAFIDAFTQGWDAMPAFLDDYAPDKVAAITGLPEADIRQAAEWIGNARDWMSCWTMGLNQSTHGTWNTNALCNLHLATGAICRPGSGPFSLTGQPNAMGGREMGYMGPGLPWQRSALYEGDRAFIENLWALPPGKLRAESSEGTVAMFDDMADGKIKACWIICTNPVATVPNRRRVIEGLQKAELVVTQDAFLDTETNRYADILLPGALWAEAEGVMVNSERNLTLTQKAVEPPGDALPDWQIIAQVACEMGYASAFTYASAAEVFEEIKRAWNPATGYDIRGASHARLREMPLQWPCAPEAGDRNPIRYLRRADDAATDPAAPRIVFPTASGKAAFWPRPHMPPAEMPDDDFGFVLNTGRLQHQWHTLTKTGKIATLNKLNPGPFIEIHPDDAATLGLRDGDAVDVRSRRGHAVLPAVVTDRVMPGNCFAPFHWNDVFGDQLCINAVTSDAVDPISWQPEFKVCAVALTRVEKPAAASAPQDAGDHANSPDTTHERTHASIPPSKEITMESIDALARLLGLDPVSPITLTEDERPYLQGFVMGLRDEASRRAGGIPVLPPTAPLERGRRQLLDGVLAGLFARTWVATEAQPLAALPGTVLPETPATADDKVLVAWASQTGNIEGFASQCAERLKTAGRQVTLSSMDSIQPADLGTASSVLLLTSTFGDGDPPDNGSSLWSRLQAEDAPRLESTRFALLAFGDSSYDQFCGFGRKLDARLEALGAQRLTARVECEPDFEEPAKAWLEQVMTSIASATAAASQRAPALALANGDAAPDAVTTVDAPGESAAPAAYSRNHPLAARVLLNRRLNAEGAQKEVRQYVFDLADSGLAYEAGDALGVWPTNCPAQVGDILAALKLSPNLPVAVKDRGEIPLGEALSRHYDITRITPEMLRFVREHSGDKTLAALMADERQAELKQWLWGRQIGDLVRDFPIRVDATQWLSALKRLQPRLYSISSSPRSNPREVHLTVSTVRYALEGHRRGGVSSAFLADRSAGVEVPIYIQRSAHFRPPKDQAAPMIMVGPGTGVAPFRAFLHDRRASGATGRHWLFFGEQHAAQDFYYRDELEAFQRDGHLHRLDTAFSRDQSDKIYVQDRMREQGASLWAWLQEGAYFYVCGDATRMARDVDAALVGIAQQHGSLSPEAARAFIDQLGREKRYVRDVY